MCLNIDYPPKRLRENSMDLHDCPMCDGRGIFFRIASPEKYKAQADPMLVRNRAMYTESYKCELCKGGRVVSKQTAFEWKIRNEK